MEQNKEEKNVSKQEELVAPIAEKKGLNMKILIFGIPLFIAQLIAVYFVTANILLNKNQTNQATVSQNPAEAKQTAASNQSKPQEFGKFIYVIEDLLVNPANTDGKRYVLSSLGFDVPSEKDHQELKAKEVLLKDAIISVMSSKEMSQLSNIAYRDTLRTEIIKRLGVVMPSIKVNTIYFSKYIID
jgi:flagellar protein FliL